MELEKSKLFMPWTDPESGTTVYLLTEKVAPVQEAFYFVNDSMDVEGRYLWFYCAFPPSGEAAQGRTLGVMDFEKQTVFHFPETQFNDASPFVDPITAQVYWCMGTAIWRRGPNPDDLVEQVNALPDDLVGNRKFYKLATHLTRSADEKAFFVDASFGLQYVFGSLPVNGSDFQMWQRFDRHFNHAQFNPVTPDLVLFSQEGHTDPITGLRFDILDRMWLIERGKRARPVFDTPTVVTHEWWDLDGQHVWCVKSGQATWRVNIETQAVEEIAWDGGTWHAHNSKTGTYLVGDGFDRSTSKQFFRGRASTVDFLNRETGRNLRIVNNPEMLGRTGSKYHIDPHPRFCGSDRFVVFTTTVRGEVDLAVVRTSDLIDRTS